MKNKLKKIVTGVLLCSAVLFSACKNNIAPLDKEIKSDETAKIVINVDSAASSRTALPVYEEYNTEDLTSIVLKWKNAVSEEGSVSFRNASAMSAWERDFSLGNWTFTMEAKIGNVKFQGTSSASITKSDIGYTVPVNLTLYPVTTGLKTEVKVKVKFPKDMNGSFVSGRYSTNRTFSSYDTITGEFPTVDDETDSSLAYIEVSKEFTKENLESSSYWFIELTLKAEDGTENGKLLKYRTSVILEEGKTSYEEFTAESEDFMTCYKITYHNGNDEEPLFVDYYTTETGYTLYGSSSYKWYTDTGFTTEAVSMDPGKALGNKDFYIEKAFKITIKDCSNTLIGELFVKEGSSYYLYWNYIRLKNDSSVRVDFDRTGYSVREIYEDINKTNRKKCYDNYTPTADETIYVDYAYKANVSLVSVNSGNEIYSFTAAYYFYLSDTCYGGWYTSDNYVDFTVKTYYQDASKTQTYNKDTSYYLESSDDIIIYVDEVINKVNTLYLLDESGNEIASVPFVNSYDLYRQYYWSDKSNSYEYYPNSYNAIYYKDAGFTERLSYKEYYLEEEGDVTVYVKLVQSKYISKTLEYNKAYKFPTVIGNSRVFCESNRYGCLDINGDYMWCFSASSSGGTYGVNLYYYPIDETKEWTYDADPTDYILAPENPVPVTPDVQSAGNDVSKYIVEDTADLIKTYQYNFEEGDRVGIDIKDRLSSDTYIYVVSEDGTKCWDGSASSTSNWFTVPSSGVYTVYVRNYSEGIKTQISHHIYAYGMGSAASNVTLQTGDIEISVSDNSSEITLTATEGFQSYEWNLAGNLVGTERILTLDKTALNAGQSYAVVLTAVTGRNAVYKTTLVIDVE